MTWFHGGAPGLSQGDLILPASELGIKASADYLELEGDPDTGHIRRDRVYITSEIEIAAAYAVMHPDDQDRAWIYEVIPIGEIEDDPDYTGSNPDESKQCPRARIRKVTRLSRRQTQAIRHTLTGGDIRKAAGLVS